MKNVLIISGHTDLAASVANKTILETLNERLPEAEIVKLDELYPTSKSTWKPNSRNCSGQTSSCCSSPFSGTPHPPYWNAGWKRLSVTVFHTEVPETSSKARNSFSLSQREHPKHCIAMRGRWATLSTNFCPATKPPVG